MTSARKFSLTLLALDAFAVLLVFNTVTFLRGLEPQGGFLVMPLIGPIVTVAFALYLVDGYKSQTDLLSLDYASLHAIAMVGAMLATLLTTYAILPSGFELQSSRSVIALSYVLLIPVTLETRRLIRLRSAGGREPRALVFVGDEESHEAFLADCRRSKMVQPVIWAANYPPTSTAENRSEGPKQLSEIISQIEAGQLAAEAIVLRESRAELDPELSLRLVKLFLTGVPTFTLELFHQVYWRKIPLYRLDQIWLFQEGFQIAREPVFERVKRVTDLVAAAFALTVTSPVLLLAALAIRLQDGGPVFFKQRRIGRNHTGFLLYKLRTMRQGADAGGGLYTRVDDDRVTRVGRILRATRIDELPQMWNVLRGQMSLIGPRAEWDRLVETYERDIPCYHFRHLVKPGITGWAQVNYPYGGSTDDTLRKLEYDLYYIRHFSFVLDASIVLKTIHVMLTGKGR
jgi:exopolysaccharide biosynthesis polyprenyl glycosylphosphotransferase